MIKIQRDLPWMKLPIANCNNHKVIPDTGWGTGGRTSFERDLIAREDLMCALIDMDGFIYRHQHIILIYKYF